jgi:hypothetical protein
VHLDSGRPRFWEKATSKVHTGASDFNRTIYLSTEYDRYRAGARARLFFTSISDFGFGVRRKFVYVRDKGGKDTVGRGELEGSGDCLMIQSRRQARFLSTELPDKVLPKRVRVRLTFCRRPFEEMPTETVSNEIEVR